MGKNVAKRLSCFDVELVYYDVLQLNEQLEKQYHLKWVSLEELVRTSDVISIHAALTDKTKGMFDYDMICKMKPTSILINTSRGALVKEEDLARALIEKKIRGAGLDVYESEPLAEKEKLFLKLDNIVMTPHIADACIDNVQNITRSVYENIYNFQEKNGYILDKNFVC